MARRRRPFTSTAGVPVASLLGCDEAAVPPITSTPRCLNRPVSPVTSLSTILASNARTPANREPGRVDAPFAGALDGVHHGGRLEERLRRDAPSQQTGSAEPLVALHDGHAHAELGRSKGA